MKNFKHSVEQCIIDKLTSLANDVDFSVLIGRSCEQVAEQTIEDIQGNYVSGWIPSQDGGFSVNQFYDNGVDCHLTEKQREYNSDQYNDCWKQFVSDYVTGDDIEVVYDDLDDEQREQFCEYELEWFEPALVQVQMFVEGCSESVFGCNDKQVTIRLSVNYKDAPYYREKYAEDIEQVVLELDEFKAMDNQEILGMLCKNN